MRFDARIGGSVTSLPPLTLCDAWLIDGRRFGDELGGTSVEGLLGRWPDELETDATVRLAEAVGDAPTWDACARTPPVARKLDQRARPQPLDLAIGRHLKYLQTVCHRPRLHLRVEEDRLLVSRARRSPVHAVADLVSHPEDWEHRTLRSIQPSRVLARQVEDEWNLYENRVAVRLVDKLLAYTAKRLDELRRISNVLSNRSDHSDEARTSFWRARRVMDLWADTLADDTEVVLRATIRDVERAQHDLQALLSAPLYQRVPKRESVALELEPTNILVNDINYRYVAVLWRAWLTHAHKRHETQQQRAVRRHAEAVAWDRFAFHLIVRSFEGLGWVAAPVGAGWRLAREGWPHVTVELAEHGLVEVCGPGGRLRVLPLCADLSTADGPALEHQLEAWDGQDGEILVLHVEDTSLGDRAVRLHDVDRATGWSFGRKTVLLGCSPWSIDSEERMGRVLNGWLNRAAMLSYPVTRHIPGLPPMAFASSWLSYRSSHLVALRRPAESEANDMRHWASELSARLDQQAQQAKAARQAFDEAPRRAVAALIEFMEDVLPAYQGLDQCPLCGSCGRIEPRPGKAADGSDATWWATCDSCGSGWGLRGCKGCCHRYRALATQGGDLRNVIGVTAQRDWPDKVLGRDVWAQPCRGNADRFRCPWCGTCAGGGCARCEERSTRDAPRS